MLAVFIHEDILVPMYIEIVPNCNSRLAMLLHEGWHEGKRRRKRKLANLTDSSAAKVETVCRVLELPPMENPECPAA